MKKLVVVLTLAVICIANSAWAIIVVDNKVHSGLVSLALGQALQVNVVNIGGETCDFQVFAVDSFFNQVLNQRVQLEAGQAAFFMLSFSQLASNPSSRRRGARAVIEGFTDPAPLCIATFEVFDVLTGRTTLFLGDPAAIPAPLQ